MKTSGAKLLGALAVLDWACAPLRDMPLLPYVASRIQTHDMCQELDENYQWEGMNQASALAQCIAALNHELPVHQLVATDAPTRVRQHDLSHCIDIIDQERFFQGLCVDDKAQINSEMLAGASDFLNAVPAVSKGHAMAPEEFVTEIKTRLLMDLIPRRRLVSAV